MQRRDRSARLSLQRAYGARRGERSSGQRLGSCRHSVEETYLSCEPALSACQLRSGRADALEPTRTSRWQSDVGLQIAASSDSCQGTDTEHSARTRRIPSIRPQSRSERSSTRDDPAQQANTTASEKRKLCSEVAHHVPASYLRSIIFLRGCIHPEHFTRDKAPQSSTRLHQQEERTASSPALSLPQHCSTGAGHP